MPDRPRDGMISDYGSDQTALGPALCPAKPCTRSDVAASSAVTVTRQDSDPFIASLFIRPGACSKLPLIPSQSARKCIQVLSDQAIRLHNQSGYEPRAPLNFFAFYPRNNYSIVMTGYLNHVYQLAHLACSAVVIALRLVPKVLGSNLTFSTKHVTCLLHVE
jgi:hypothetical protein